MSKSNEIKLRKEIFNLDNEDINDDLSATSLNVYLTFEDNDESLIGAPISYLRNYSFSDTKTLNENSKHNSQVFACDTNFINDETDDKYIVYEGNDDEQKINTEEREDEIEEKIEHWSSEDRSTFAELLGNETSTYDYYETGVFAQDDQNSTTSIVWDKLIEEANEDTKHSSHVFTSDTNFIDDETDDEYTVFEDDEDEVEERIEHWSKEDWNTFAELLENEASIYDYYETNECEQDGQHNTTSVFLDSLVAETEEEYYYFEEFDTDEINYYEVVTSGILSSEDKATDIAMELYRELHLSDSDVEKLKSVFVKSPYFQTKQAISQAIVDGISIDEILIATELRDIWSERSEFSTCYHKTVKARDFSSYSKQVNLSWGDAFIILRIFEGYPTSEEVILFLDEVFDIWKQKKVIQRMFRSFHGFIMHICLTKTSRAYFVPNYCGISLREDLLVFFGSETNFLSLDLINTSENKIWGE